MYRAFRSHVFFFQISFLTPLLIILVSDSFSCFSFVVSMHEISCVGYTPCARDPRPLQPVLDGPCISRRIGLIGRCVAVDRLIGSITNIVLLTVIGLALVKNQD